MILFFFFFNDTATTEIYTLSLHDALPISAAARAGEGLRARRRGLADLDRGAGGLPDRAHRARAGLRVSGRAVVRTGNARRRLHRRRALPAQRPARSTPRDLRQEGHDPLRPGP